jgi:hypothetical protein
MEGREPSPDTAADDDEDGPAADAAAAVRLPGPPQAAAAKPGAAQALSDAVELLLFDVVVLGIRGSQSIGN